MRDTSEDPNILWSGADWQERPDGPWWEISSCWTGNRWDFGISYDPAEEPYYKDSHLQSTLCLSLGIFHIWLSKNRIGSP